MLYSLADLGCDPTKDQNVLACFHAVFQKLWPNHSLVSPLTLPVHGVDAPRGKSWIPTIHVDYFEEYLKSNPSQRLSYLGPTELLKFEILYVFNCKQYVNVVVSSGCRLVKLTLFYS